MLFSLSVAVSLGGAAVLYLAMEREFDFTIKHFIVSPTFASIAALLCGCGFLIAAASAFIVPKKLKLDAGNRDSFPGITISILAGLMCAISFVFAVKAGVPEGAAKQGLILAEVSFTALSAIYFFLRGSGLFIKKPAFALSGLLPALMSAFALLNLYFDDSDPLNAPLKIYRVIMIVTFMMFFTAEAGISISRPKMNGKFVFASLFAISSGGMIALSRLAARITDPDHFGYDVIEVSLFAAFWLYALVSFAQKLIISLKTPCENDEDDALLDNEGETEPEDDESKADGEDADADDKSDDTDGADADEDDEAEDAVDEEAAEAEGEEAEDADDAEDDADAEDDDTKPQDVNE